MHLNPLIFLAPNLQTSYYESYRSHPDNLPQIIWHDASRSQWKEYAIGLHGSEDRYMYIGLPAWRPNLVEIDQSWYVGCRSRNDRQTSRQTDKQNGMTIRLTLCERDAIKFLVSPRPAPSPPALRWRVSHFSLLKLTHQTVLGTRPGSWRQQADKGEAAPMSPRRVE